MCHCGEILEILVNNNWLNQANCGNGKHSVNIPRFASEFFQRNISAHLCRLKGDEKKWHDPLIMLVCHIENATQEGLRKSWKGVPGTNVNMTIVYPDIKILQSLLKCLNWWWYFHYKYDTQTTNNKAGYVARRPRHECFKYAGYNIHHK